MIQLSHIYRQFPLFFSSSRPLFMNKPTEGDNPPTTLERAEALGRLKNNIEESFQALDSSAGRRTGLTLITCIEHVRALIARFSKTYGENCGGDLPEIATLVLERVEAHLDSKKTRMAAVKTGTPPESENASRLTVDSPIQVERDCVVRLTLYTPDQLKDGGMKKVKDQARPVMRNMMTGYTLTDEEMQALAGLGNDIQKPQEMEEFVLIKKIELLSLQIEVLTDVLREWFQNGVLRFEIPELGFLMNDLDTLTLKNYLEVHRTLDDAKILKNFSIALRNLHRRLSLLMTYCDAYKDDPTFYQETMESLQPFENKVRDLIEDYNKFLGKFQARVRDVLNEVVASSSLVFQ